MKELSEEIEYRILYADTDAMGVMYYANYLRIYEAGRGSLMRKIGFSFSKMEEMGIICPAINVNIEYIRFAKFDSIVKVRTKISKKPAAKLEFIQELYDSQDMLLNRAIVNLGFVKTVNGRATRCPACLMDMFDKA
jgi:acyl-CoA thioester hydrolase